MRNAKIRITLLKVMTLSIQEEQRVFNTAVSHFSACLHSLRQNSWELQIHIHPGISHHQSTGVANWILTNRIHSSLFLRLVFFSSLHGWDTPIQEKNGDGGLSKYIKDRKVAQETIYWAMETVWVFVLLRPECIDRPPRKTGQWFKIQSKI